MKIDRSRDEEAGNVRYNFSDGFKNIFQYFGAMKIDQCRDEEAGRVRDNFGMVSRRVVFGIILINQYN